MLLDVLFPEVEDVSTGDPSQRLAKGIIDGKFDWSRSKERPNVIDAQFLGRDELGPVGCAK